MTDRNRELVPDSTVVKSCLTFECEYIMSVLWSWARLGRAGARRCVVALALFAVAFRGLPACTTVDSFTDFSLAWPPPAPSPSRTDPD